MIKQIFKIIWNERRINSWIVTELILIFTILWFCCNYLSILSSRYMQPTGFDITNTYQVKVGTIPSSITGEISEEDKISALEDIVKRLKTNPQVENVSLSITGLPYSGSYNGLNYKVDSIAIPGLWNKRVNADFFDVFRIKFLQGRNFTSDELVNENAFIMGNNNSGILSETINIMSIDSLHAEGNNNNPKTANVVGIVEKSKRSEYEPYYSIVYEPLTEKNLIRDYYWGIEIAMRVKPEADNKDFRENFIADMRPQLDVKPFFLIGINPISDQRTHYLKMTGASSNIKSTLSVLLFLMVNISLGIIGTFWLRIESRRSEIGLQMALGASRTRVRKNYILEAIFLLLISSIVGFILAMNIQATGILDSIGLPMLTSTKSYADISKYQEFISYSITLILLSIIVIISVWYPSQKASRISPASVLRGE